MAQRLQLASVQECAWARDKYLVNWQGPLLNGLPLKPEAMSQLAAYQLPPSGVLQLDYVTFKVGAGCWGNVL